MVSAHCLNGEWQFMPLYEGAADFGLPAELVYEEQPVRVPSSWRGAYERPNGRMFGVIPEHDYAPYEVFGYPKEWAKADAGVLHRTFTLPESMTEPGLRIFLRLDGIMQKAAVYLDGRRIAVWEDGYLPLRVEVTDFVKPGSAHDLHVVCGSFEKVTIPSGQTKITALAGSWFGALARGLWQDVYLESRPAVSLADITIRTSVREGLLEVGACADHPRAASLGSSYRAVLAVREADRPDSSPLQRAEAPVEGSADGGRMGRLSFRLAWKNATHWNPDRPFLYELELTLLEGDRVVDRRRERFGFREVWTEGPRFVLNGTPLNLRGDSWHFQGALQQNPDYVRTWYRMCKEAGVNCIRLHAEPHPAYYLDIADEEGMLIVDETAIYGSGKSMQADHPAYLENCRAHCRRLVERDRNHPSVILWSVQNEMRWVDGRDGFKLHIPALMDIMGELDPTRPMIAEGDNRLLAKEHTEVESRHYNIDGTIAQWDRQVPLVFGEHGGWWYICPQNSSMYVGLDAYRNTDECGKGLAEKERLFVEYARRQGVSGLSTFNFAHYFLRAMPDRDIPLPPVALDTPGPKPKLVPRYSLTLNNGLLPEGYPAYRKNPAFDILAAAFKPATLIPAEYNRSFFDDAPISRSLDVYNDTLYARRVRVECVIRQEGRTVHRETFHFPQEPADRQTVTVVWTPEPAAETAALHLQAVLYHDDEPVHELNRTYKLYPSRLKTEPVAMGRPVAYVGGDRDYAPIAALVPGCKRLAAGDIGSLAPDHLLVAGSKLEDADGQLERELQAFVARGGRLLLLEQLHVSLGRLAISRQDFLRAHGGSYEHPVLRGLSSEDLMFWHEELREEGPLPIIHAAFEKPVKGDFTLILECSAGDFGDGGDLWSPLLEYRSGKGGFLANQLELMDNVHRVPEALLLLRNLLAYAGEARMDHVRTAALVQPGGRAEAFLNALDLSFDLLPDAVTVTRPLDGWGLVVAEPRLLLDPAAAEALKDYARRGGTVVLLPAEPGQEAALAALLARPVAIREHETYHLEAAGSPSAVRGFSPVDLFGFDKVFLSPREVVNRPLALHSLTAEDTQALCVSVEGTAWKDYFIGQYTDEYSRVALVELNRDKAGPAEPFVLQADAGSGRILLSQLLPEPESDKAVRLYTRLLANLGASFADGLLASAKGDAEWAVETVMALPCRPHLDYNEMKAYYTDPEFSLNNLGEGLYGWMQKKERSRTDGSFCVRDAKGDPWFLSCFVHQLDPSGGIREGRLQVNTACDCEIYLNGSRVADPERYIALQPGMNRLIAIVQSPQDEFRIGLIFKNPDGSYMRHLQYRLTLDEVEPK